jgi:hypothetical protein
MGVRVVMVLNATFNNFSVISWWSGFLVEETREYQRPAASHRKTRSHKAVSSTLRLEWDSNPQL